MTEANPFVGTWRLVSCEIAEPDGTIRRPFGRNVVGYLIYTADGYMAAEIMNPDRRQSDPSFTSDTSTAVDLPDLDRARAYDTYLAYCGTYRVEGDRLIHHVKAGLIPSWTGSDQVRPFRFDGDRLVIEPDNTTTLIWERAVKRA